MQTALRNQEPSHLADALASQLRISVEDKQGLLEEANIASWTSSGAVDKTEWVAQIRTATTIFGPYQLQEASHASYWGQKAMRNCLRLAYNGGAVRGGHCVRAANGLNAQGEPNMGLQ